MATWGHVQVIKVDPWWVNTVTGTLAMIAIAAIAGLAWMAFVLSPLQEKYGDERGFVAAHVVLMVLIAIFLGLTWPLPTPA